MSELVPVLTKEEIDEKVRAISRRISNDYKDHELVIVSVLKGSFIFLADLVRYLTIPVQIDFVRTSSYGSGTVSAGSIVLSKDIELDIKGKDVLIVDDIVDTGLTLSYLIEHLRSFGPRTVRICALLAKHERRQIAVQVDYVCHEFMQGFLVGYGLDYAEAYRHLPAIYHLKL
ncbi:MAG: hypoxanthine phosphoribosyltransferase [Desulfobacterales bacterium]|jgi:hypoxanthine phosphoribosyltransferase|nr:hypoxanthine phosphoribosyltransferase [Desulfobacterales bacterium]